MRHASVIAALVVAAFAASASQAGAADAEGNFALRGFGAETCTAATARLQGNEAATSAALSWMLGYATAFNRIQSETFDISPLTDATAVFRMVIGVCQKSPDSMVETVAFDILRTIARARVTSSSPVVEMRAGEVQATVRRETLVQVQAQLVARGHLSGKPDGTFGPQTQAALTAFQEAQDLPQTGVASSETIVRLLVELPAQEKQ